VTPQESLSGVTRLFLDSAPAIYFFEKNPTYVQRAKPFFLAAAETAITVVTSTVTLAKCLVVPVRMKDTIAVQTFTDLLTRGRNTDFRVPGIEEAQISAWLRNRYNLKLADALQVAVALTAECDAILTNDAHLRRVSEMRVIVLDDLTES
jgi:predicted nucleic acid-binding protein